MLRLRHGCAHRSAASTRRLGRQQCRSFATPVLTGNTSGNAESLPAVGTSIHGFTLRQTKHVPELHLTALQLQHDKTGAEYLHVARDDKNNVFAINFKTNPTDRTGLPHVLEHVTLCGSDKFPVRDPFFKMIPRSLANFMNAFTSSDYTSYPFATTNPQDYKNLASVYLDSTLHPLLKRTDFLQEGWRLGPQDPREAATKDNVVFKGVVYNEMKGQMSDASYLFYVRFREHLFPSLQNSGGDPDQMTNLTYDQLVRFSKKHYHPSNAKLFSYGNLPLADHLHTVDQALSHFSKIDVEQDLKTAIALDAPVVVQVDGPLDTMQPADRQVKSSLTWLGPQTSDIVESFSVSIVMCLLMTGYGSPFYQGLIESGLGTNFSPNSGYDSSSKVSTLTIGLDGMRADDVATLPHTIHRVLREKAADAFAPHKVDGYLHQLELALRHKTAAFGMGLLEKVIPGWFNGVDPMDALSWNEVVDAFKTRIQQKDYLYSLVDKYLLNDRHMQFTMVPTPTYHSDLEASEADRRQKILGELENQADSSEAALAQLTRQELDLLHEQESAPYSNIDTLPTLHVDDIARQKERRPRRYSKIGPVDCLWRETSTNGITYFQAKHLLKNLPQDLRVLLPLFTESLLRLGTKTKSVADVEADILLKTGGISVSTFTAPDPFSLDECTEGVLVDGYALDRNVPAMLDLIRSLLHETDFSSPNAVAAVKELLESKVSGALDAVADSGNAFAISSAAAALSKRGRLQDQLSGLSQIEATSRILGAVRTDPAFSHTLIEQLKQIQRIAVTNADSLSLRIVCEPSQVGENESHIRRFLTELPAATTPVTATVSATLVPGSSLSRRAFFNLPFQVSYTGSCLQTVPYSSPDKAPLTILGQLLTHNYMLPEIREKGGAYGASASASPISSLFSMSSYRDPDPRNTLNVYEKAGIFAKDRVWTARELEESKLSVFQQIDAPTSVGTEASKEFIYGITEDMDQQMRERLLDVTKDDVQRVAQQYLVDVPDERRSFAILGDQKKQHKDRIALDGQPWQVHNLHRAPSEPNIGE
ncbi:hypothetical protein DV738_g2578, partial [Chaetothyriales sp. CBS 135597]